MIPKTSLYKGTMVDSVKTMIDVNQPPFLYIQMIGACIFFGWFYSFLTKNPINKITERSSD